MSAKPEQDRALTMLAGGATGRAGVRSRASTGSREAIELREWDRGRFAGLGVLGAVNNVNGEIAAALVGRTFADQAELDRTLIELDGTATKSRLGANSIVGVSMAAARAFAAAGRGLPLRRSLCPEGAKPRLPVPHFNVVNGGAHALNVLDFQEFMLARLGAPSLADAVRAGAEIYATLRGLRSKGLAFTPEIDRPEDVHRCSSRRSITAATAPDATAWRSHWIPPPLAVIERS